MAFKLVVGDVIEFSVKFTLNDGGKRAVQHAFTLFAKRMSQAALRDLLRDDARLVSEVLHAQVTGWRDQRLVVDDATGQPAEFGPEALECLLGLAGMGSIAYTAYLNALVLADTAQGKEKN